jgi:hypothetical protein
VTTIHRIGIAAVLLLSGAAAATAQTTNRNKHDEVARTIAACGEPMRDHIFPDVLKTRLLTYREATLWFMNGDNGWFFRGW